MCMVEHEEHNMKKRCKGLDLIMIRANITPYSIVAATTSEKIKNNKKKIKINESILFQSNSVLQ